MSHCTEQATYREQVDLAGDDVAEALAYVIDARALATATEWTLVGRILARWTQLQVIALDGAGTSEILTSCRAEATRLMKAIQQRQGMPPLTTPNN